ncbi:MAG TPA: hypothetical protein VIL48_16135 [Acidimicrobiales bacterium]
MGARPMVRREPPGDGLGRAGGGVALEVEVALGELAAGIGRAKSEIRRMRAAAAGWEARGVWGSGHPSIPRDRRT